MSADPQLDRDEALAQLRRVRAQLELIERHTGASVWELDLQSGSIDFDRGLSVALGHGPEVALDWLKRVNEEDRSLLHRRLVDHLRGGFVVRVILRVLRISFSHELSSKLRERSSREQTSML